MKPTISISRKNLLMTMTFIFSLYLIPMANAQLSGTYTIDPSGGGLPNFTSFDAAVNALVSQGISGPVVINIVPGTFDVHIVIPQITGASASNTITFQSSVPDSTQINLNYTHTNVAAENYLIKLDGADYVTFKSMTFNAYNGDAGYGTVFQITGSANNNKFFNNAFYGKSNSSSQYISLIYSNGTKDENNVFENNLFVDGSAGINITGASGSNLSTGTVIRNNSFKNQYSSSISLKYQEAPIISGNNIDMSSMYNAIYLEVVGRKFQILNNRIIVNGRSDGALEINGCNGLIGSNGLIANNMVSILTDNSDQACSGIKITNSTYQQVYHNSVLICSGIDRNSSALYQSGGSNIDIRNNNLANLASGYAYTATNTVAVSDYNNYYTNGNYLARWQSTNIEDLTALITPSPGDEHSVSVNPVYNSDTDLHTTTFRLENKGTNLSSVVSVDFDGETRSVSPDIGADEFITSTGSAFSGVYYIGGASPDFATITEAVQLLNKYGILSAVTFNIRDDNSPYIERFNILPVTGASENNTVTFQSDPSNTEDPIITFNIEDYYSNYIIGMQRASYVKIKGLFLTSENQTYGDIIRMDGLCHHDTITGCTIMCQGTGSGNDGIYSTGSVLKNLYISKNKFNNGSWGIELDGYYQNFIQDIEISENDFFQVSSGINISEGSNSIRILRNKINSYSEGINIYNYSGSLINKGLIANNFIYLTGNSYNATGLNLSYVSYLQVFFNTVKIGEENTYINSRAFSLTGTISNTDIRNNIFCNFGIGYAYYLSSSGSPTQSDYNSLFTAGNYIAYYNGDRKKLSDLQAISGKDINSLDVNPAFISDDEVHINSPYLDGSGTAISGLISDIDGEMRSSPPDIGADEYTSSLTPIPGGTYKIGGSSPDYNTIKQAFDDLQIRGVAGQVVFEIRKGEYYEFIGTVFGIPGCTSSDSVIVRSESGDPEDVIIYYDLSLSVSGKNIFHFKGVENFTLENLTISTSGAYSGNQVEISGSSENFNIIGNEFIATSYSNPIILINGITDNLLIRDNLISGSGGIGFGSSGTAGKNNNSIICNNYFSEGGIQFNGTTTTNTHITGNIISGSEGISYNSSTGTDTWIVGNRITVTTDIAINIPNQIKLRIIGNIISNSIYSYYSCTGVYISSNNNSIPYWGLIANNMIRVRGQGPGTVSGIDIGYNTRRVYLFNNNINVKSDVGSESYGININESSSNLAELKILNNIVSNSSGSWVLQNQYAEDIAESDYNNFYTTGTNFIKWGGTTYNNLAAFRSASGMDAHSLTLDPLYLSETDLHSTQIAFQEKGTPLEEVPFDIDSIPRDPVKPDIGAVEFTCSTPVFNVLVSPTCFGDTTTFIDKSTNIVPGSTYGWDFDGDYVPDEGYISIESNDTVMYYFDTPGDKVANLIVSQLGGCLDYTSINVNVQNSPVLDIITKGAYCGENNGEATVHATEGVGPYKYFWSNGSTDSTITDIPEGIYTVSVTSQNGCISTAEVKIENAIKVNVMQLNPSTCGIPDGKAVVEATGGVAPYSYVWSDGCTTKWNSLLSPGRYYVNVIDANKCSSMGFVDIENDGSGPQITLKKIVHNKCWGELNGSIKIGISGGVQPYSIQWSNGVRVDSIGGLAAGIFDVVVTAADGCIGAGSFEINQPAFISISSVVENASCGSSDGRAMVVVSGGKKPYKYQWLPSGGIYQVAEGIPAGIYSVTVRDANACVAKVPVMVNNIGGPVVTINSVTGTGCIDNTNGAIDISVSGGTPLYKFEWSPGGQTTPDISGLSPGIYEVRVTDAAGCIGANTAIVEARPEVNPICLVTVDTITGKNMVVWEKMNTTDVDYYVIYRESSSKNIYQPVGISSVYSPGLFIDSVADPMLRSWKYRLSVVDVCGNESQLSDYHKTIHLTMSRGITENAANLIWNPYEGFEANTYEIYKRTTQATWLNLTSISSDFTSYTDISPNMDNLYYYIALQHPTGCVVSDLKAETLNTSRSNRQSKLKTTGIPDYLQSGYNFLIWPNPSKGIFNLSIDKIITGDAIIRVHDITGKVIYINEFKYTGDRFETTIDISLFADGVYYIFLQTGNQIFQRVLIKE
jgi:hypothetical protein